MCSSEHFANVCPSRNIFGDIFTVSRYLEDFKFADPRRVAVKEG